MWSKLIFLTYAMASNDDPSNVFDRSGAAFIGGVPIEVTAGNQKLIIHTKTPEELAWALKHLKSVTSDLDLDISQPKLMDKKDGHQDNQ